MQINHFVALVIQIAYKNGIINFETYCEIKKTFKECLAKAGHSFYKGKLYAKKKSSFLWESKYSK